MQWGAHATEVVLSALALSRVDHPVPIGLIQIESLAFTQTFCIKFTCCVLESEVVYSWKVKQSRENIFFKNLISFCSSSCSW